MCFPCPCIASKLVQAQLRSVLLELELCVWMLVVLQKVMPLKDHFVDFLNHRHFRVDLIHVCRIKPCGQLLLTCRGIHLVGIRLLIVILDRNILECTCLESVLNRI
jgi:hypothetical protein